MTAKEKTSLSRFLNLSGDYIKDGHARERPVPVFSDDIDESGVLADGKPDEDVPSTEFQKESPRTNLSSLPLAYQIDESDEESENQDESISEIVNCNNCGLGAARINAVPGEGAARPLVMVIGEGPGAEEDKSGRPFVGKAGQLLDKMLASIGLFRESNCFIANVVKCRPPENRDPAPEEIAACMPYLERQIALLRPQLILCAGRVAAQSILKTARGINALRLTFFEYTPGRASGPDEPAGEQTGEQGIPVLCTFHPSAILRDEALKRPAWEDLKLLRLKLVSLNDELSIPAGEG